MGMPLTKHPSLITVYCQGGAGGGKKKNSCDSLVSVQDFTPMSPQETTFQLDPIFSLLLRSPGLVVEGGTMGLLVGCAPVVSWWWAFLWGLPRGPRALGVV